jgi:hypothetical protein
MAYVLKIVCKTWENSHRNLNNEDTAFEDESFQYFNSF